jgi:TonB family protein
LEPIRVDVPQESFLRLLDGPIVAAWALATGILLLFFGFLSYRAHHLRGQWRKGDAGGQPVLISDEWGPAVVGFIQPQIVLPGWCRDIDDWSLRFILDHELEHVRAGDLRLLILAGILPIFFPWHLPAWWQLARLRTAIEGDCDFRVLNRNPGNTRPYVDLLLAVGERSPSRGPMAAMLSEPYETLKRRIKIMTMPFPKRPWIRGGIFAGVGIVLLALACWTQGPTDASEEEGESQAQATSPGEAVAGQERAVRPVFTPYSVPPAIKNLSEVQAALRGGYPPLLQDAGIGGTVEVWLFIDEDGQVQNVLVNESSGHRSLDEAALQVAMTVEFRPAVNRDQSRSVWISLPIQYTTENTREAAAPEALPVFGPPPTVAVSPVTRETGGIIGTAVDAAAGEPIASVQIYIPGAGLGSLSNKDGRFLIPLVPVGEQDLVAELIGYGRISERVTVTDGETTEVKFILRPTAIGFSPLVVEGSAKTGGIHTP